MAGFLARARTSFEVAPPFFAVHEAGATITSPAGSAIDSGARSAVLAAGHHQLLVEQLLRTGAWPAPSFMASTMPAPVPACALGATEHEKKSPLDAAIIGYQSVFFLSLRPVDRN